jgi:hypothetical protein
LRRTRCNLEDHASSIGTSGGGAAIQVPHVVENYSRKKKVSITGAIKAMKNCFCPAGR